MTDYSEAGAQPVEDAAVARPPTVDEVLERQRREHPEQVVGEVEEQVRLAERPGAGAPSDPARIADDLEADDSGDDGASGEPG